MNMSNRARWLLGIAGALMLLFGLLCLNYTKMGDIERHTRVAQEHGWPPPSTGIVYLGMLFAPLGAGMMGFAIGRSGAAPSPSMR
jgi:hypothetical protein